MSLRALACVSLFGSVCGLASAQAHELRQVAAPPEDILSGLVRLPEAGAVRTLSRAASYPVVFERADDRWVFETTVPLDSLPGQTTEASFAVFGRGAGAWTLSVAGPDGLPLNVRRETRRGRILRRAGALSGPLSEFAGERLDLVAPEPGAWTVRVESTEAFPQEGFVVVSGGGDLSLSTHLTTLERRSDRRIGVAATVLEGREETALIGHVSEAELHVESLVGAWTLTMFDDGQHDDGVAGDGTFGAWLPLGVSGPVTARVMVEGQTREGSLFVRSSQHAFTVIEPACVLDGTATATVQGRSELAIDLGVTLIGRPRLHASTEVWGTGPSGELVPVCWLSRMVETQGHPSDQTTLSWVLDTRWLDRAGAGAPLELRHVRVQDPDTHVPHDLRRRLALSTTVLPERIGRDPVPIEPDMLKSIAVPSSSIDLLPGSYTPATPTQGPALMTTHGYCSSDVWQNAGFSEPRIDFLDLSQARTHDQFAQGLLAFGSTRYSYGIIAHSQGGAAALQLYTYYESGLDRAMGPRKIQSVGTPYQGTPLASFGGFTCGVVDDLTPDGAILWLAGIPSWARADVHYWTTSNDGFPACNFVSDLFLSNPDDGVIEMSRGQLPGGNNRGHTTGWCHSSGMSDPPQTTDAGRNAEMDAQAAR